MSYTPYQLSESAPIPPPARKFFTRSNWKAIAAVILVVVVVSMVCSVLIYTQPWSKIRILIYNDSSSYVVQFVISIDGDREEGLRFGNPLDSGIAGVWSVQTGTHRVAIDYYFAEPFTAVRIDGDLNFVYDFSVGPLSTKNVYVHLSPG